MVIRDVDLKAVSVGDVVKLYLIKKEDDMRTRLKRVVVFVGALLTLIVGWLPAIIIWIITDRMYPLEWIEWSVTGEHLKGKWL